MPILWKESPAHAGLSFMGPWRTSAAGTPLLHVD